MKPAVLYLFIFLNGFFMNGFFMNAYAQSIQEKVRIILEDK